MAQETAVLTFVARLGEVNEVLAGLQVDGMTIESVTPITRKGITEVFVIFRSPLEDGQEPYDVLVWLEAEYGDKLSVY